MDHRSSSTIGSIFLVKPRKNIPRNEEDICGILNSLLTIRLTQTFSKLRLNIIFVYISIILTAWNSCTYKILQKKAEYWSKFLIYFALLERFDRVDSEVFDWAKNFRHSSAMLHASNIMWNGEIEQIPGEHPVYETHTYSCSCILWLGIQRIWVHTHISRKCYFVVAVRETYLKSVCICERI